MIVFTDVCRYCGKDIRRVRVNVPDEVWGDGTWVACKPMDDTYVVTYHMPRPLPPIKEAVAGLQRIEADLR